MKVKTCHHCSYTPEDLGNNYDPNAKEWCCGRCSEGAMIDFGGPYYRETVIYPEKTLHNKRRKGCHETVLLCRV